MDIFGNKKRKRIKAEEAAHKERYNIAFIQRTKEIYRSLIETMQSQSDTRHKEELDRIEEEDNTCPKCGSKDVNDRIQRTQGEISGSSSGSMSGVGMFGFGAVSGHSSSSINGKIGTNEINKCNNIKCGHEWKKAETCHYIWNRNIENCYDELYYALLYYKKLADVKYDPSDITEKYNSLEEKQAMLKQKAEHNAFRTETIKYFSGYEIESVLKIAEEEVWPAHSYDEGLSHDMKRLKACWAADICIAEFGMKKFEYDDNQI